MKAQEITQSFNKQLGEFETFAHAVEVTNADQANVAAGYLKGLKELKKAIKEYWDPICDLNYKSWKMSTGRRKEFLDPAESAEKVIKGKVADFHAAERKRVAEEEERRRQEAEALAEQERITQVEQLRAEGMLDEAEHVAQQPLDMGATVTPEAPKTEGLAMQERWSAELVSLPDLIKFCATKEGERFHHLLDFNQKEANKLAVAQKEMFDFPGIKAVKKLVPSVR